MGAGPDALLRILPSVRATDRVGVFAVLGELDMHTRSILDQAVERCPDRLVLDLRDLSFLDSAGIHAIIELRRRQRAAGGWLRLVYDRSQQLARVLQILGLTDAFPPYADVETAIRD
jgi:anti-sigma B factor antagonist